MKRFLTAICLCSVLLVAALFFSSPGSQAQVNINPSAAGILDQLLKLPAPPPPNPMTPAERVRDDEFYNKSNPPKDDAPLDELIDYWTRQSSNYQRLRYNPKPSPDVLRRLIGACEDDPKKLPNLLQAFPTEEGVAKRVKDLYDDELQNKKYGNVWSERVKRWLTYNSKYFSDALLRSAKNAGDQNEYVSNQEELLALAKVDWDSAKPIVDKLMLGEQKTAKVLAQWAAYVHALDSNSLSDIEKYRGELKGIVEDKAATDGMRDLAFDALVKEADWDGRDDWYFTLLEDETLSDLRVNGSSYTGLTTIILYSAPEKYMSKMLELLRTTDKPAVRENVIRNLGDLVTAGDPEVIKALLPWLLDPKWAKEISGERRALVDALKTKVVPESVPGLIAGLNERTIVQRPMYASNAAMNASNTYYGSNAARAAANAAAAAANAIEAAGSSYGAAYNAANTVVATEPEEVFPLRDGAIAALAFQKDPRAITPLRNILPQVTSYMRGVVISAMLKSKGFPANEQVAAIESYLRSIKEVQEIAMRGREGGDPSRGFATVVANISYAHTGEKFEQSMVPVLLGQVLMTQSTSDSSLITDELVFAMANRIDVLQKSDPILASSMRIIMERWDNPAVNIIGLRELKRGSITIGLLVRLLGDRRLLRDSLMNEVYDARSGTPAARGIGACLVEDRSEYEAILGGENIETKIAMLSCARMIRAKLPLQTVAGYLTSDNRPLAIAAERYLETVDSPEARKIILTSFPNTMRILGARSSFVVEDGGHYDVASLTPLYESVADGSRSGHGASLNEKLDSQEKRLKKEMTGDKNLLVVYAYNNSFIRLYADKAVFSWQEDDARYWERPLKKEEFDNFRNFVAEENIDVSPPYLSSCPYCEGKEFLMFGRAGGRRVFFQSAMAGDGEFDREFANSERSKLEADLDQIFAAMRKESGAKLHYWLEKQLPGLEILYTDENLQAQDLWKNGADFRLLIEDAPRLKKVRQEMEEGEYSDEEEYIEEDEEATTEDTNVVTTSEPAADQNGEPVESWSDQYERRRMESYAWHSFADGKLTGIIPQPSAVEFFPAVDASPVKPNDEQWKARGTGFELRTNEEGVFKVTGSNAVKLKDGSYSSVVATPNGKWAIAVKSVDYEPTLVRINLQNKQETVIKIPAEHESKRPFSIAFIPALNRVLIFIANYAYASHDGGDESIDEMSRGSHYLLDPETGAMLEIKNDVRPLRQQLVRPLQPTGTADTFWAAIPDKGKSSTLFGTYNTKTLLFKSLLTIPEIQFTSMSMWVDAAENKLYFVYQGHLLRLPLPKQGP